MSTWAVTTAGASLEFDTQNFSYGSCSQIDVNHFIIFWEGVDIDGYAQVFTVNTSTWAVTTANSALEFDTQSNYANSCSQIDANHFINFWGGVDYDGFVQVFTVNTSTWAVTTANSALEFDTQSGDENSCYKIDTNHFINFWVGAGGNGFAQVFSVNTSTWAVTTANSVLNFDTQSARYNSCYKIDANHFINFWQNDTGTEAYSQVFSVNTSTWAVTTAGNSIKYFTDNISYNSCSQIDTTHYINFWRDAIGVDGEVQIFTVNTSTWAVTTAGSSFTFDTGDGSRNSCFSVDSTHFINFWQGADIDGFVQVFTVNTSTWAVTTANSALEFDTQSNYANSCSQIDANHFINFWGGVDVDGFVQVFAVEGAASGPANLKTLNTNAKANIKTINTVAIASIKSYNTIT